MKPKLFFIPHYLGSLKYFEKLIPYLKQYEVGFLFLPIVKKKYLKEMINYCNQKQYYFEIIDYPYFSFKIPFISSIINLWIYKKKIYIFLNNTTNIKKLISVGDTNIFFNILFEAANKKNIETMVMQWALNFPRDNRNYNQPKRRFLQKIYYKTFNLFLKILKLHYNNIPFNGGGNAQKLGLINQMSYNLYIQNKINPQKITIIGYLDFALAEQAKTKCQKHSKHLQQTLGIKKNKKNIIIFTTPFYDKDNTIFQKKDQTKYYQKIINSINKILGKENINIIIKIHPAENIQIYKNIVSSNLIVVGKNIDNIQLVCLSDLYIAHHSTTNFIPIILNKEAIFINFTNLKFIENSKKYLGIKQFIKDFKTFEKLLLDFKNGKLKKQYYYDNHIITKNSLDKILQWIN